MASRTSRSKAAEPSDVAPSEAPDPQDLETSGQDIEDSGTVSDTALTLTPRVSSGVVRAPRTGKSAPNPVLNTVVHSLENDTPLAFDLKSETQAKDVKNLLRRAAQTLGCGLKLSTTAHDNGTYTVDFHATARKRTRKYSADDIRAWAKDNGYPHTGPVTKETREAFKAAHATTGDASDSVDPNTEDSAA